MRKIYLTALCISLACTLLRAQSNVGIGTSDPKSKLDVAGGLALREGTALTLVNGNNDNIVLTGNYSFYRITGPTAAFSIAGIVPATGADGQVVTLVNTTTQIMTIKNNASGTAANTIKTLSGSDMDAVAGNSSVSLQYNKTAACWYVTGSQNFKVTASSLTTKDIVPGTGSAVTIVNGTNQVIGGGNVVVDVTTNALNQKGIVPGPSGLNASQAWVTDASGNPAWAKVPNANLQNASVTVTAGSGLSGGGAVALGSSITLNNSAPDQTVVLNNGTAISVSGTYPNFTINNTGDTNPGDDITTSSTAGGDLSGTFSNLQLVANSVTGTEISNGTIAAADLSNLGAGSGQSVYWNGSAWTPFTPLNVGASGTTNYVPKWTGANTLSATSLIYDNGTGVGIGTTSPGASLEIGGTPTNAVRTAYFNISGNNTSSTDRPYFRGLTDHLVIAPRTTGTSTMYLAYPNDIVSGTVNTRIQETVFITATGSGGNGNVGIGNASPGSKLHVMGSTSGVTDYGIFTIGENNGNNNTQRGLSFGYDATNEWAWMYARTVGCCGRKININNTAYIEAGGNVGIGTSAPAYKLDVTGSLRISSDNTTGGGLFLADDGSIVDNNDGYATARFSKGVIVTDGNNTNTARVNLTNSGTVIASAGLVTGSIQMKQGPNTGVDGQWHTVTLDNGYAMINLSIYATGSYMDGDIRINGMYLRDILNDGGAGWYGTNGNATSLNNLSTNVIGTGADNQDHYANCPDNYIATGFQVYANNQLDGAGKLRCTPLKAGFSTVETGPGVESAMSAPWNASDNIQHASQCPPGTFVKGFRLHAASYWDGALRVYCTGITGK